MWRSFFYIDTKQLSGGNGISDKQIMLKTRKVINETVEEKVIETIIQLAVCEGLTINNVKCCMEKVAEYMKMNASIHKDHHENW